MARGLVTEYRTRVREFRSRQGERNFVWLAIDQLQENRLLENEIKPRFSGQSRRQVLKTIGLASIVAVPVMRLTRRTTGAPSLPCPAPATTGAGCGTYPAGQCASTNNCNTSGVCAP